MIMIMISLMRDKVLPEENKYCSKVSHHPDARHNREANLKEKVLSKLT